MSPSTDPILAAIENLRQSHARALWQEVLDLVLKRMDCPLGSIHLMAADGQLHLTVHRGLPPVVQEKVLLVPVGKGMAGIAAERRSPVQVCNLQTDASGVVRPGAKDTKMEGAVACPMIVDGSVVGVLGVAKPVPYEFSATQMELLATVGAHLGRTLPRP